MLSIGGELNFPQFLVNFNHHFLSQKIYKSTLFFIFSFFFIFHSFKAATNNNKNERKCSAVFFFLLFFFISLFPNGFFFGERSWCVHEHEVTINRFKKCRQLFRFFHFTSHCARLFHFFFTTISLSYYLLLWGNFSLAFSCCIAKKKEKKEKKRKEMLNYCLVFLDDENVYNRFG